MLNKILNRLKRSGKLLVLRLKSALLGAPQIKRINLCSGSIKIPGFYNLDVNPEADFYLDLQKKLLPFRTGTVEAVVCMSAINYFTRARGAQIVADVFRVLQPGGVARFGTQDLELIARKFVERDHSFFFQKLANGRERFVGKTMADKFNSWFYGYAVGPGRGCKYFYDFETLAIIFQQAGFSQVERRDYRDSRLAPIEQIDNRPEQMFFLEAVK